MGCQFGPDGRVREGNLARATGLTAAFGFFLSTSAADLPILVRFPVGRSPELRLWDEQLPGERWAQGTERAEGEGGRGGRAGAIAKHEPSQPLDRLANTSLPRLNGPLPLLATPPLGCHVAKVDPIRNEAVLTDFPARWAVPLRLGPLRNNLGEVLAVASQQAPGAVCQRARLAIGLCVGTSDGVARLTKLVVPE